LSPSTIHIGSGWCSAVDASLAAIGPATYNVFDEAVEIEG
jgi:hypothetical protein